jgi:RNA-directed DNA polymerase
MVNIANTSLYHSNNTCPSNDISDKYLLRLLWQYMSRTVCFGETYRDITKGISLGCPLSPLMGALFLKPLDDQVQETGLYYVRFMDDWVIIAPTRWKLKKTVRDVNQVLKKLLVEKHPDKTFIGKAVRGFDFLGYFLKPGKLAVADKTISNMVERVVQLYEQDADLVSIGQYVRHWRKWAVAGIRTLARDEYDFFRADTKKVGAVMPLPRLLGRQVISLVNPRLCRGFTKV